MLTHEESVAQGKSQYRTRFRQMLAVKRHLIGLGVPDVSETGVGYGRRLHLPGYNLRVVRNLRAEFQRMGRREKLAELKDGDTRGLIVFEVPLYAEDPDEILVTMEIGTFARLVIDARGTNLRKKKEII